MEKDKTKEWSVKEYTCGWCTYRFTLPVRTSGGQVDPLGRVSKKYSTQVKCPYCGNFLKTWDEGTEVGTTKDYKEAREIRQNKEK
jgi:DNA-directed RNA polymerase subunit RPC12/RpoP